MTARLSDRDRIGAAWRKYRTKVIPIDAPAIQAMECRRAFYAGAAALLTTMLTMLDPGEEATVDDLKRMDDIHEELERFAQAIAENRA